MVYVDMWYTHMLKNRSREDGKLRRWGRDGWCSWKLASRWKGAQERLCVDRHLAAVLEPVVVVHYIWLCVIKSPVGMVMPMRSRHSIRCTRKDSVICPVTRLSWQRVTELGKVMLAVEIST